MSKFLELTRYAKNNPVSLEIIFPSDMPLMNIAIMGDAVTVTCKEHKPLHEVVAYVNRETRRGGWLTCAGYPTETAAGWEWRFVQ